MNIGVVTEFYYPTLGGIQEHVHHFAREARRQGHRATIITGGHRRLPTEHGVVRLGHNMPVYFGGSVTRVTVGLDLGRKMRKLFDQEAFDVVHIHSPFLPTLPYLAQKLAVSPTIGTLHTNFKRDLMVRMWGRLLHENLRGLDGLISVSPTAARAIRTELALERDIRVIPNGVDVDEFAPGGPRVQRFDDGVLNVLLLCRLEPRNGVRELLDAFSLVARRESNVRLIIAGDGPMRARYESEVPQHARDRVHFVGPVLAERGAYYRTADVVVAPMLLASFGIVLLEAMAAGRALVANDIEGFRDVMRHGREGYFANVRDPEVFADAILRLLRDADLRRRFGDQGRLTADRYDWPRVTQEVLAYYRDVLRAA